ncbi:nitrogen regulatory IIA protein [Albibacterium indicum]|uniref:nitrogen regulatory IIA protein n=1 Tax=Albibacterium indicum TaxID=2292082 RepID=UPI000E4D4977|nr:nitrogen regulatory IIA protein [Pedobacter indicus]
MKNLRTTINNWFDKLDGQWRAMPVEKQHRYTLLLFSVYALLSIIVLLKVCYDVAQPDNTLTIEHIENPINRQNKSSVSPQDSINTILKRKMYERQ